MASITRNAALDDAHAGDIRGALGTIPADDSAPRAGLSAKLKTLLAIVGPGLIVMCGDNDAGAFSTYGQAGQNYGTRLLWTLLLLIPVLYVNQEMVLRLRDGARVRGAWPARRFRADGHRHAADHRHRRHYRGAVAAVLPAVLRGRQADYAAVHPLREGRPVDRHRDRGDRRGRADGRYRRRLRRDPGRGPLHRRRRAGPRHRGPRGTGRGRGVRSGPARRRHHRVVRGL